MQSLGRLVIYTPEVSYYLRDWGPAAEHDNLQGLGLEKTFAYHSAYAEMLKNLWKSVEICDNLCRDARNTSKTKGLREERLGNNNLRIYAKVLKC